MLTTEKTGLAGPRPMLSANVKVRLVRAICIDGKRVEPGPVPIEVDRALASMLVGSNKAERFVDPPRAAEPPAPPPADPGGEIAPQPPRRGRS